MTDTPTRPPRQPRQPRAGATPQVGPDLQAVEVASEIAIAATDPITAEPQAELWVDHSTISPVLKARILGAWEVISGGDEVFIGTPAPSTALEWEIWVDTTDPANPVLNAKIGGVWVPLSSLDEVWVGDNTAPPLAAPTGTYELWYDTTQTPGSLNVAIAGVWTPLVSANEVIVGGTMPTDPTVELWVDTTPMTGTPPQPPVLYAQTGPVAGPPVWTPLGGQEKEVYVGLTDPYLDVPTPVEGDIDIWFNTTDDPATQFVRIAGAWQQVTQREVFVDDQDPLTRVPPSPEAELWYDTSTDPGTLYANVNGVWEPVSGPELEVSVGLDDPYLTAPIPVEDAVNLWWDTTDDPGTLKVRVGGVWVTATQREVWVDDTDPYLRASNPAVNEEAEIWYDTTDDPGTLKVRHNGVWLNATAREVWVDDEDPYLRAVNPAVNEEAELWYDTTDDPGTLKVRHNAAWINVTAREVWVDDEDPYTRLVNPAVNEEAELWFDTTQTPGILMVRHNAAWIPAVVDAHAPDEVSVSDAPPRDIQTEIWVDTSTDPATFNYKDPDTGAWTPLEGVPVEEVIVGAVEPPDMETDLWWNTVADELFVRVAGRWERVLSSEVHIGAADPAFLVPRPELWVNSRTDPPILYGWIAGGWKPLIGEAYDEVWIGAGPPDPAKTYELWVNNTVLPPTLSYKNPIGQWIPLGTSEVEIGVSDPYLDLDGNKQAELWQDLSLGDPGVLKYRIGGIAGSWRPVAEMAQSEIETSQSDPIGFNPQAEMWIDTSTTPITLWGRVNNAWVQITGPTPTVPEEVHIGPTQPMSQATELWYDTSTTPGILKANNFGVWVPIGDNEMRVGPADPYLSTDPFFAELWYDTTTGILKVRSPGGPAGAWIVAVPTADATSEVEIGANDPRAVPGGANPLAELWHDTTFYPGTLKVWVNGAWVDAFPTAPVPWGGVLPAYEYGLQADPGGPGPGGQESFARGDHQHGTPPAEVAIGTVDPRVPIGPAPPGVTPFDWTPDLWLDTNTTPAILKANVNAAWVPVSSAGSEVEITDTDPYVTDAASTAELWYDTTTDPGVLKARVVGVWVTVSSTGSEVSIGIPNPLMSGEPLTELWYTPNQGPPLVPPALWDIAVTYQKGDYSQHPTAAEHWQATAVTTGQEPGTTTTVTDGYQFPGPGAAVGGLTAPHSGSPVGGFEIRVRTNGTLGTGTIVMGTDLADIGMLSLTVFGGTDLEAGIRGTAMPNGYHQWRTPLAGFSPATRPWIGYRADPGTQTITFQDSVDGVTWQTVATVDTSGDPMALAGGVTNIHLGNNTIIPTDNYSGVLGSVTVLDSSGGVWSSWDSATQPNNDGTGVSPATGENYAQVGPVALVPGVGIPVATPWVTVPAPPTSTIPGVLRANVNGVWENVTSGATADEVWVGPDDPDITEPGSNRELWYDTDEAVSATGADEVWIGPADPMTFDPGIELWYTPSTGVPVPPPPIWAAATAYVTDDIVAHPDQTAHWQAARATTGEEPGVPPTTTVGAIQFPGSTNPSVPNGYNTDTREFGLGGGVDVRVMTGGAFGEGVFCSFIAAMGAEPSFVFRKSGADIWVQVRTGPGILATVTWPVAGFSPTTHPWIRTTVTSSRVAFYQSADNITWEELGNKAQTSAMHGLGLWLRIGHMHQDGLLSYSGVLGAVETRALDGTLWTQWTVATQPNTAGPGSGVSPTTGEDYYIQAGTMTPVQVPVAAAWASIPVPAVVPYVPGVLKASVNGDWQDVPATGAVLKAQVHAHHIAGPITSGATEVTRTLAAGDYLVQFQCSGVCSVTGIRYANLDAQIGGAWLTVGQSKHWFNAINIHYVMSMGVALMTIPSDGDYLFRVSLSTSLTMDVNDFGAFILTPASPGAVSS